MTNTTSLVGSPLVRGLNAASLWVILLITAAGAVLTLVLSIIGIATDLTTRSATLNLVADKSLPRAALGGSSHIGHGTYDIAVLHVSHLHSETLGMNATSEIAAAVVAVGLWVLVAYLSWRLLHGRALRKSVSTVAGVAGIVMIFGGVVHETTGAIATGLAARQLNAAAHNSFWPLAGRLNFSVTGIGLVLLVIALVFEYGARLQKDTEGLV